MNKHVWSTADLVRFAIHEFTCKVNIVGGAKDMERRFAEAERRFDMGIIRPDEFVYELNRLIAPLNRIILRAVQRRRVHTEVAPVEIPVEFKPGVAVAKPKKTRTAKPSQQGVQIGVEPKSRRTGREVVKVAKAA